MEAGDELGLIGMQIKMDWEAKQGMITQPKCGNQVIEAFEIIKGAPNPALIKLLADDPDSPMLEDQANYISKCVMLMLPSQHTYPEIHPVVIKLSTKYNKVTKEDMKKAIYTDAKTIIKWC